MILGRVDKAYPHSESTGVVISDIIDKRNTTIHLLPPCSLERNAMFFTVLLQILIRVKNFVTYFLERLFGISRIVL